MSISLKHHFNNYNNFKSHFVQLRSSSQEVFLGKVVLKVCSKCTGEHPCRSAISIKLLCNFIEITFRHGCSPVNLLHIFRTPFLKNTSGWLLLTTESFWKSLVQRKLSLTQDLNEESGKLTTGSYKNILIVTEKVTYL